LSIMKQYIQAIYLLTFFISVPLQPGVDALFTEFLKSFGASENCPSGWSEWSECLGTETENVIHSLPAVCQATTIGRLIKAANRMVDSVLNYYRNVNRTVGPCGMCLKQVKCTNHCLPDGSLLIRLGKPYGVQERFCPGVEQSYACAVDSEIGYDPMTHECNLWPPKENTFPIRIPLQVQLMFTNIKPFNCIRQIQIITNNYYFICLMSNILKFQYFSVSGKCFCCCSPYRPDPCTAKCVIHPCTEKTILTESDFSNQQK
ncbi:Uncharacterized protein T03_12434, partial [Trichinella britovi]